VPDLTELKRFEEEVIQHLDAAYNMARWLTRNSQDAEDVVQEACLRAYKYFKSFHGGNVKAWLLAIVRNTCYTWRQQNRAYDMNTVPDDELENFESDDLDPETKMLQNVDKEAIHLALDSLPTEYREVLILREFEGLSYREIADMSELPIGTVMSRLARARKRLQQSLFNRNLQEVGIGS